MMKFTLPIFLLAIASLFCISCEKDPIIDKDPELAPGFLLDNEAVSISYEETEETIKFFIEDLANTSKDISNSSTELDYVIFFFDVNTNSTKDSLIDKKYTISSVGGDCMHYYLTDFAYSPCYEEDGFTYEVDFVSTEKSNTEHIVYNIEMKKELVTNSNLARFYIDLEGKDSGTAHPGGYSAFLSGYFEIEFE